MRFHRTWKKIKDLNRMDKWRKILLNFIDEELVDTFIITRKSTEDKEILDVNIKGVSVIQEILSSGQNIILYIITEIVANIRLDTLLLFDEPETHLHPNAISQLVNTIYDLVNEFQSYCIIATHSPLIIQEMLSKNVYILERFGELLAIRKLNIETFGANLTTLTDEVFGNREVPKQYKLILEDLVNQNYTFEKILSLLESDEVPLSLNARMYIKSLLNEKS